MGETRRNKYGIGENVKMTDVKGQRAQEIDSLWGLQERAREMQMLQYKHSVGCDPNTICHGWAMKNPFTASLRISNTNKVAVESQHAQAADPASHPEHFQCLLYWDIFTIIAYKASFTSERFIHLKGVVVGFFFCCCSGSCHVVQVQRQIRVGLSHLTASNRWQNYSEKTALTEELNHTLGDSTSLFMLM